MSDIVKVGGGSLIDIINKGGGDIVLPKPFEREVFLFDTHIAGTTHIPDIEQISTSLAQGDRLEFLREPGNRYDHMAILVRTTSGQKIGYVPRDDNAVFARLMDAGKMLFARIDDQETRGTWLRIGIKVYLQD